MPDNLLPLREGPLFATVCASIEDISFFFLSFYIVYAHTQFSAPLPLSLYFSVAHSLSRPPASFRYAAPVLCVIIYLFFFKRTENSPRCRVPIPPKPRSQFLSRTGSSVRTANVRDKHALNQLRQTLAAVAAAKVLPGNYCICRVHLATTTTSEWRGVRGGSVSRGKESCTHVYDLQCPLPTPPRPPLHLIRCWDTPVWQ